MSETNAATSALGRLLWPERTLVTDLERKLAVTRIERAVSVGHLDEEQARQRLARLDVARTRADLCALEGGSDVLTPPGLRVAPRMGAGSPPR